MTNYLSYTGAKVDKNLSRPRRFGKSLLISTLAEIFSGNQELFKGLWIHDKIKWTKYPVIHIDFSKIDYETPEKLKKSIKKFLDKTAKNYGSKRTKRDNMSSLICCLENILNNDSCKRVHPPVAYRKVSPFGLKYFFASGGQGIKKEGLKVEMKKGRRIEQNFLLS